MTERPFFSVVVPTHNRASLLPRALGSVRNQGVAELELVVVDDGSTDATPELLATIDDPRLVRIRQDEPRGAATARNTGSSGARGHWLLFLDDDDALQPGALEALERDLAGVPPSVGFAWCAQRLVVTDDTGTERVVSEGVWKPAFGGRAAAYRGFLRSRRVGASGLAVRRECFFAAGGFDESLGCAEDTDLLIRLARDYDFRAVSDAWIDVHLHQGPRLTVYGVTMAGAYARIIEKHREVLDAEPAIAAELRYKAAWLHYHGHDRAGGRHHLLRALRARPLALRLWCALALFELAGPYAPSIHQSLASRRGALRHVHQGSIPP
jgi:glycosyltransferase involved in cell wall biosynthesis